MQRERVRHRMVGGGGSGSEGGGCKPGRGSRKEGDRERGGEQSDV